MTGEPMNKTLLIHELKAEQIRYEYKFLDFCRNGKSDIQLEIFENAFGKRIDNLIALTSSVMNGNGRGHISKEKQRQLSNELSQRILSEIKSLEARWVRIGRNVRHGWKSFLNMTKPNSSQRRSLLTIIEERARNYLEVYRTTEKLNLEFKPQQLFDSP